MSYCKLFIFVALFLFERVASSTIGVTHQENVRENEGLNNINGRATSQENRAGDQLRENKQTLVENKNSHFVGAVDNGEYANQDSNKNIYDDNRVVGGHNFNQNSGEKSEGGAMKKGHKKGHHNAGFRNSYHRDESSNNSSYFDDYSDEADESKFHRGNGRFGNQADDRYSTRHEDGVRRVNDNSRRGNYDRRGGTEGRNIDYQDYDRRRYEDDRRDQTQRYRGQDYAERDRGLVHAEALPPRYPYLTPRPELSPRPYPRRDYYDEPKHLPPPPPPLLRRNDYPSETRRETITIYEDPRIDDPYNGVGALRDKSDLIRLDVRPGGHRFQRYDSYYGYKNNRGINRRSDINPLVFNYKKY